MVGIHYFTMAIAALIVQVSAQNCATINPANPATFASGYSGKVLMNGLRQPRGLIFDNEGNILTTEQGGYGVRYIKLTDGGGTDVCVASNKQLIADSQINHGIALTPDGKTLFVSSLTTVWSWTYDGATGTVSNKKTVIQNMRNGGFHLSRTLLVPKANPDVLLVQRGSQDNIDTAAAQESTARSMIKIFKISEIQNAPVDYDKGQTLAWGLRNTVGFGEHPDGGIWSVDNGVDDMQRDGRDIHHTNPCEEMNYHGRINDAASPERGAHHGYPECHAVWDTSVIPNAAQLNLQVGTPFAHGVNSGDATCRTRQAPKLCFPAHTAPLDIKFHSNGTAAYIPFHGSWNKSPPDGYRISRVEFNAGTGQPIEPSTSTTAATNIMYNANNAQCPNRCFRPTNVAFGPKGQLFMTSDTTNEIWVIAGGFE
ncbi:soluble quino protein glucose dehydrogenase [Aaosphaeria arxii CBS 175.79]|uniref:Soluble quino protein glucose dehydrogenase n=1 Tax=Aaosphaeria arxii CBS 175.79 TaxID=1450172 RepID=A0A6A5XFD5_9PLEO|nr:soluble quino protein glucose dehydrogenase [Aaosphaeria arxii CBS 175.79]KAF2011650.1 soluble quino protein glucose dehydrogenase [Aaosphaeria arxii CBS 175.79]